MSSAVMLLQPLQVNVLRMLQNAGAHCLNCLKPTCVAVEVHVQCCDAAVFGEANLVGGLEGVASACGAIANNSDIRR
jgi:hypothetical protein